MSRFNYFGATTVMENLLKRKWSATILRHLETGIHSPADICAMEPELTAQVMNERLRTMLRYNLISRSPARAQVRILTYKLTPRGQRILKMLSLIEQFDQVEDLIIQTTPNGRLLVLAEISPDTAPRSGALPRTSSAIR
jgi:DNA-binding HxlR family transcriptional regulator